MENPRIVHRFLLLLVGGATVFVILAAIYYRDFHILLVWFASLAALVAISVAMSLLHFIVFVPLLWAIGRLTGKARNQS